MILTCYTHLGGGTLLANYVNRFRERLEKGVDVLRDMNPEKVDIYCYNDCLRSHASLSQLLSTTKKVQRLRIASLLIA